MTDDRPYEVLSPTKIKLGPAALEQLQEYVAAGYFPPGRKGREEFGKYLLQQHEAQQQEDRALSGGFSENIEDRREETFVPDKTQQKIWGEMADVPMQGQTYGPNPLANQLGFTDIGQRPAPAPQIMGPLQPSWPAAFGSYQHDVPLPFD
jgi:hypothetical protein